MRSCISSSGRKQSENQLCRVRLRQCVEWRYPHDSFFGSLSFIICINDLDSGRSIDVSKFVDDTKVGWMIQSEQHASVLQVEIDILIEWARKW